ncbi:probable receptor-like protein kinase At5g24010 [Phragmites australis]|uniref:probable receptor-like protein kinase At5g24010 n=1 Tax=Phragmites australis TaxID=29695 RepID=UPI002D789F39|nr:probable receptor-like protein kinase At5g24010 [Phragmites australis]
MAVYHPARGTGRQASTTTSMAVLVVILLVSFLPSTALAAFSPAFSFFLACGATSNVSFPSDSPARIFTPDAPLLTSSLVPAVANANSNPASPLYAAARASSSAFSYRLTFPASAGQTAFLVLRLHFFPFAASQSSVSISSARFTVSVLDEYTVLSSFSPPSAGAVKEFFVPAGSSEDFGITFTPDTDSAAFVNAIELFPAPAELLWNRTVTQVGAAAGDNIVLWQQQALETVYRLNVGGPKVTKENDTLWRTWLPDDPFLYGPAGLSAVNKTSSPIFYDPSLGYTREVAPDIVYKTQRTANLSAAGSTDLTPGIFNVTWTLPAEPGSNYLVRLHFCDYELLSSVVGVGIVFNVFVGQAIATQNLTPKQLETQSNQALYIDYAATAPIAGNLTVSIGESGFLNGLEIMKLRRANLSSTAGSRARRKRVLIIALSAVLGASVLACAVLCLFVILRRRRRILQPAPEEKESTLPPRTQAVPAGLVEQPSLSDEGTTDAMQRVSTKLHISLEELKAATDNFHERNLIGVGGFGNVYRGVLRDGTRVAVKRAMRASKQGLPEFQTEIVVLSRIRHRHLVSLIGYCNEQAEMILVYEYMEKGTLRSHLYGSEEPPLSWKQRLEICIGAARGLHYLHTGYSENIIHRDVKSTNILLGDGFIAKVADFGLSRIGPSFGETHVSTAVKGSFGYLDPEYFKTQYLTDRSDVYSFGVVLFEVLCARPVIDQGLDRDQINLGEWAVKWQQKGQLDKIADQRIVRQVNENSLRKFAETAAKCLADYGLDRPSMSDVLWNLEYCLQLQETHVRRDAFEDSGAAATQFPEDVVVPRWPSSTSFLTMDETDVTDVGVANSKVFSQLSIGDGR